jgi:hypothetical protein
MVQMGLFAGMFLDETSEICDITKTYFERNLRNG